MPSTYVQTYIAFSTPPNYGDQSSTTGFVLVYLILQGQPFWKNTKLLLSQASEKTPTTAIAQTKGRNLDCSP